MGTFFRLKGKPVSINEAADLMRKKTRDAIKSEQPGDLRIEMAKKILKGEYGRLGNHGSFNIFKQVTAVQELERMGVRARSQESKRKVVLALISGVSNQALIVSNASMDAIRKIRNGEHVKIGKS